MMDTDFWNFNYCLNFKKVPSCSHLQPELQNQLRRGPYFYITGGTTKFDAVCVCAMTL
jgi:hypothetical protein